MPFTIVVPLISFRFGRALLVSENEFDGPLPEMPATVMVAGDTRPRTYGWAKLKYLVAFAFDRNKIEGTLPAEMFIGLSRSLKA